jgi:DNA primase
MDRFEDAKLRVKDATDLVALIESYVPLKPKGRQFVALCPFHAEKSPSFYVTPDKQFYHCFGCGKNGDVFTFLMEREGLTFREAMEVLADRAKISLDGVFGRSEDDGKRGPDVHQILGEVRTFFQQALHGPGGQLARDYLEQRGLTAAIDGWALGYHPYPQGALRAFVQQRRLPTQVLEDAGLLRNGREPYAGRVIFPIEDERGRVVGFGGRLLPGGPGSESNGDYTPPKYINSPESAHFHKRTVLFGLHRAKQAGARRIVVMEGYTDVIASHLAGFPGAVAALGTSFTQEHTRKIERYASEGVVLLFDGDRAGHQAAERAMRELVNSPLQVRIALMSEAKDPGEVLVARPGEDPDLVTERRMRFADLLEGADDALATWFRLLRQRLDVSQAAQLEAAARECGQLLALVDNDLRRQGYLQEMARHLAVPPQMLERMLKTMVRRPATPVAAAPGRSGASAPASAASRAAEASGGGDAALTAPAAPSAPAAMPARMSPTMTAEHELLACVLHQPSLLQVDAQGVDPVPGPFESPAVAELLSMVRDAIALGRLTGADVVRYLFTRCADRADLRQWIATASQRGEAIGDPAAFLKALQRDRQRQLGMRNARTLRQQLQQALSVGDRQTADRLTQQLVEHLRQERPRPATS